MENCEMDPMIGFFSGIGIGVVGAASVILIALLFIGLYRLAFGDKP